jgi:hypothetical protein
MSMITLILFLVSIIVIRYTTGHCDSLLGVFTTTTIFSLLGFAWYKFSLDCGCSDVDIYGIDVSKINAAPLVCSSRTATALTNNITNIVQNNLPSNPSLTTTYEINTAIPATVRVGGTFTVSNVNPNVFNGTFTISGFNITDQYVSTIGLSRTSTAYISGSGRGRLIFN